jgi:hypothetical protein
LLGILAMSLAWSASPARAEEVRLPITLDYPFIRAVFIRNAFTAPGEKAVVANQDQGCTLIELWDLQVAPDGGRIKLRTRIKVKAGLTVFGKCLDPVNWEGWLDAWQEVGVDAKAMRFTVRTVDSKLYRPDGQPATVANIVLKLVKTNVHAYLDQLTINLQPPVKDLGVQLPLFFREDQRQRVEGWLASLRPLEVQVLPQVVKVLMTMQVELPPPPPPAPAKPPEEAPPLSPQELSAFVRYWEAWDSYLVAQIMTLAGKELTPEERDELLAAVLEARIGFVQAMAQPGWRNHPERDLVREQFLVTWRRLAPILRKHLLPRPSASLFNYLAFITANDALDALDKLGPVLGLEISRQGMMRLARLVNQAGFYPELDYTYEVDPKLRALLGFGPPLPVRGTRYDPRDLAPKAQPGPLSWLVAQAWAGESASPQGTGSMAQVLEWAPPAKDGLEAYLKKVQSMLKEAAGQAADKGKLNPDRGEFFGGLILATAWQESCWRQFTRVGGGLVYLRSYNNTSVGIMQINERVWRGLYDLQSLRWDTVYNAQAGCEIMENFLRRYALKGLKPSQKNNQVFLAQALYAVYNGGPAQLKAFQKRHARGRLWLSDKLFLAKYKQVKNGELDRVGACLGAGGG